MLIDIARSQVQAPDWRQSCSNDVCWPDEWPSPPSVAAALETQACDSDRTDESLFWGSATRQRGSHRLFQL